MSCHQYQEAILESQADGERWERHEAVASHLLLCAHCRLFAQRQRRLQEGLGLLKAADGLLEAPGEVEARLREMLRPREVAPAPLSPPRRRWSVKRVSLQAAALAACLLLVSWVSLWWRRPASESPSPVSVPPPVAAALRPSAPAEPSGSSASRPPTPSRSAISPRRRLATPPLLTTAAPSPDRRAPRLAPGGAAPDRVESAFSEAEGNAEEVVTEFIPLYPGQRLFPIERGRLIRTFVPRSLLGTFGLPVHPDWAIVPIKADVVVGEDGTARAVRFVREEP